MFNYSQHYRFQCLPNFITKFKFNYYYQKLAQYRFITIINLWIHMLFGKNLILLIKIQMK